MRQRDCAELFYFYKEKKLQLNTPTRPARRLFFSWEAVRRARQRDCRASALSNTRQRDCHYETEREIE